MIDIKFCESNEVHDLMNFIGDEWSKGHILSSNRYFFDWQHAGTSGRQIDFVIAKDNHRILGCLGFILSSRFDSSLVGRDALWFALWKNASNDKMLGIRMHNFLIKNVEHSYIGTLGINPKILPIYKALDYKVGVLNHFYLLNDQYANNFCIAKIPKKPDFPKIYNRHLKENSGPKFKLVDNGIDLKFLEGVSTYDFTQRRPQKSIQYFKNRFMLHPFYKYQVYAIHEGQYIVGWLVLRICYVNQSKVIRIVELHIRELELPSLIIFLKKLMLDIEAEYSDFLNFGYDPIRLISLGMKLLDPKSNEIIIPNYFEPFIQKNISLHFAFKDCDSALYIHKADADQDRPNLI